MYRKAVSVAAIAGLIVLILLCQILGTYLKKEFRAGQEAEETGAALTEPTVVLDPGHGGIDAGKPGINGVEEKEINLKIALKIKELLNEKNIEVVMTRDTDDRLADSQREDLKERVAVMNREKPVISVSIHQNSYHEENVHGAQVFYHSQSEEGERASAMIQECLNELQPDNEKKIKSNDTYYILKKTEVPTVIVECGFLSNYEEAQKLSSDSYQEEIAVAVAEGVFLYIEDIRQQTDDDA